MPGNKEVVKKRTTQQKKVYAEDSSDEESDEDSPQPKKSCLERCTLSPVKAEPPKKSATDRLSFLSQKITLLASSPQKPKPSTTKVSCMTPLT